MDNCKHNLINPQKGALKRILDYKKRLEAPDLDGNHMLDRTFLVWGDASKNIASGQAGLDSLHKFYLDLLYGNIIKREHLERLSNPKLKKFRGSAQGKFDLISCQFAMHYFFQNTKTINEFLLNVSENLKLGGFTASDTVQENVERVFDLFPILQNRGKNVAGYLSGGEQQMLAIGRALMSNPKYLLLDEPSLGLAPKLVEQIAELIKEINSQGVTVLLVEQNANMALKISDHGYIMETGYVVMDNPSEKLLADQDVREFYLGLNSEGTERKSFKDVKHYKRKKRWLS